MNTATLHETTAIAAAVQTVAAIGAGQDLLLIPLSQLRPSSRNVRKSGGTSIPELAASIARVGLLQNLTVVLSPDGEHYEVVAGRRRLAALKLLVKRRKLAKDHEVPCLVVPDAAARTVSLTENVQREAMHPADQFEAFAALVAEGRAVEDIAADFGVTPLVVQRRLRLANVSPRLLADYRADAVTLDQLMALAITDDHAAQEAAFYDSPQWQRSPDALRDHLTQEEIDAGRDPVARFVGLDAYEQAGGGTRRDLFADEHRGVFLADAVLLDTLARDKLAAVAEDVRSEGWGWVDVAPRATYADLHRFQRVRAARREPGKAEAKRIAKLEAEQAKLQERLDDENEAIGDDEAQALQDAMDAIGNDLDAIERKLLVYPVGVVPMAGAVVSLDSEGAVVVHRGLVREDEAKALRAQQRETEAEDDAGEIGTRERPSDEPPALTIMLASIALFGLGIFGPGIATGLVAGAPQLSAGAAAGTVVGGAGLAVAGGAAVAGAGAAVAAGARMAPGAARSVIGGAAAAGRTAGAAASGGSGMRAAGAGLANVARSGAGAVGDRVASGAKAVRDRVANFVAEAAAPPSAAATASADTVAAPSAPPAWAQRLQRHQRLAHGATVAAHTLRSGDSGGSGASPSLRDDS